MTHLHYMNIQKCFPNASKSRRRFHIAQRSVRSRIFRILIQRVIFPPRCIFANGHTMHFWVFYLDSIQGTSRDCPQDRDKTPKFMHSLPLPSTSSLLILLTLISTGFFSLPPSDKEMFSNADLFRTYKSYIVNQDGM